MNKPRVHTRAFGMEVRSALLGAAIALGAAWFYGKWQAWLEAGEVARVIEVIRGHESQTSRIEYEHSADFYRDTHSDIGQLRRFLDSAKRIELVSRLSDSIDGYQRIGPIVVDDQARLATWFTCFRDDFTHLDIDAKPEFRLNAGIDTYVSITLVNENIAERRFRVYPEGFLYDENLDRFAKVGRNGFYRELFQYCEKHATPQTTTH